MARTSRGLKNRGWSACDQHDATSTLLLSLLSTLPYLAGVFKFIYFGGRFLCQKVTFSLTENAVLLWTEGRSRRKRSCVFKFIRLNVQGRSLSNDMYFLFRNSPGMFIRWLEGKRIRWYKLFRCIKQKASTIKELIFNRFWFLQTLVCPLVTSKAQSWLTWWQLQN